MIGIQGIRKLYVPRLVAVKSHTHLQMMGHNELEAFALWAGTRKNDEFHVRKAIIPDQNAYSFPDGVCVTVEGAEMHRINVWLYENQMTLMAQIHSHPHEAYHSETDDTYPLVTSVGSLSLVAPDFAVGEFDIQSYAAFRLDQQARWIELSSAEVADLIIIED